MNFFSVGMFTANDLKVGTDGKNITGYVYYWIVATNWDYLTSVFLIKNKFPWQLASWCVQVRYNCNAPYKMLLKFVGYVLILKLPKYIIVDSFIGWYVRLIFWWTAFSSLLNSHLAILLSVRYISNLVAFNLEQDSWVLIRSFLQIYHQCYQVCWKLRGE